MQFLTFPKISGCAHGAGVRDDWVATEKIHGAQLVVGCDGIEVAIGKRKAWLDADEPFFGWQLLRFELDRAARGIQASLGTEGSVWIYGELFGGCYPHPDVDVVPGLVPVQTGIWYAPDLRYTVFDIAIQIGGSEPAFLSHDRTQVLAHENGLMTVPVLGRGRRAELETLPVRYPSRVPAQICLPPIHPNDAEGYVLKPTGEFLMANRPCIKLKIPEFDEQRFDESAAFEPNIHLTPSDWFALAERLVNSARIASARSKVGVGEQAIVEEVVLDALIDLRSLFPRAFDTLTPALEEELSKHLEEVARSQLHGVCQAKL